MSYGFQVTIDSSEPHVLAQWWAAALGWEVEPSDESMIRGLVDKGLAQESDTTVFDGKLVWKVGAAIKDVENPDRPRVLFQLIPEAKSVKNRVHLDVRVGPPDAQREVADKLIAAGATFMHDGSGGPYTWITLSDPEGNEFCVS